MSRSRFESWLPSSLTVRVPCERMFVVTPLDPKTLVPKVHADPLDLHWLAGLLEGEGSFCTGPPSRPHLPVLEVAMTDRDVIGRVGELLDQKVVVVRPRRRHWQTAYAIHLVGSRAVAWMRALRPLLGRRRQGQIDRAIASYDPRPSRHLDDQRALAALDRLEAGQTVKEVARYFGVTVWCIYDLRLGRTHKHLPRSRRSA